MYNNVCSKEYNISEAAFVDEINTETLKSVPSSLLTCCLPLSVLLPGHDCSIRLWNMESKTCIQEFTAHRKKFEESIHDVAFHPTKCYIGSAGADALAKVFV